MDQQSAPGLECSQLDTKEKLISTAPEVAEFSEETKGKSVVVMHGWHSESTDGLKGGWSCDCSWNFCSGVMYCSGIRSRSCNCNCDAKCRAVVPAAMLMLIQWNALVAVDVVV